MAITLKVGGNELYDEANNRFITTQENEYTFEYSLQAISLWEMKYKKPFPLINQLEITNDQLIYFVQCCELSQTITEEECMDYDLLSKFIEFLQDVPTATTVQKTDDGKPRRSYTTSETIYASMANAQVPFECDKWNIHRLLMMLQVISVYNNPNKKKRPMRDVMAEQRRLNLERRAKFNTKG